MVRLTDLPEFEQRKLDGLECPEFDERPFVAGPALSERRIALVSSAGLILRGDRPVPSGDGGYRVIPDAAREDDVLMSHVSVNFDRTAFYRDPETVLPRRHLRELTAQGVIAGTSPEHLSFMGATAPDQMAEPAREAAELLKGHGVDSVLLAPV